MSDVTETTDGLDRVLAIFRDAFAGRDTFDLQREGYEVVLAQLPIRHNASITPATYGGIEGYWVQAEGTSRARIGVMVHGGGFVMGSAKGYRAFAAEVSAATDARVFVPDFRLAPEHPFPAGLEDVRQVLAAAIDEVGSESCFAIGDSAGGGLVLSSLLEKHGAGESLPACVAMISPLIDLTVSNPSFEELASVDPICRQAGTRRNAALYLGGQGREQAPAAFPMLADLSWMPSTLVLVGGREVLRDDSRNFTDKLRRENADVEYHEYPGMTHVWPLFASFLPEGQQALDEIGAFVKAHTVATS